MFAQTYEILKPENSTRQNNITTSHKLTAKASHSHSVPILSFLAGDFKNKT